ncbi:MAG: calcium/sodium antiporter [Patescibacteria group bacterium]
MFTSAVLIIVGIIAIGKGSDWLTDSLVPLAKKLGVSGVAVGLILVSAAVSLPEILVAVYAVVEGAPTISLGVILGSIVCNIGLMTGLCALQRPLHVTTNILLRDGIFSIVVPILIFAVSSGGEISRIEGLAFFLLFIPYVVNVFLLEKGRSAEEKSSDIARIEMELKSLGFDKGKITSPWLSFGLGLVVLLAGTYVFGGQLISLAKDLGFNELIIGLTIGAIGPSIPNIVAAYKATKRGMTDIAVSETLGSNIFTLLVTLGILAVISPITISDQWRTFDLPAMIFMSVMLFVFCVTGRTISRLEGGILLGSYILLLAVQIAIV